MPSLIIQALALQDRFLSKAASKRTDLGEDLLLWEAFGETVSKARGAGSLDGDEATAVRAVSWNVVKQAGAMMSLEEQLGRSIDDLSSKMGRLFAANAGPSRCCIKRQAAQDSLDLRQFEKRSRYSVARSTSQRPPVICPDPIRQFFIDNIANPYPTASQKDTLCKTANITRKKLESDLTNWRRRSEWTDIMNTYCRGNKELMRHLIEDIESGKDVGEEVMERYERMKGYLEKRDEQAGEWVFQIEEMVRNGEIGSPAAQASVVELDEVDEGLERMEDSTDADAEGESDDDFSSPPIIDFRSAPARLDSKPGFQLVPMPSSDSGSTSPGASEKSPVQAPSIERNWTTPSALTTNFTQLPYTKVPSTKSSYSSLSAASGMAALSHSRSTSGATSTRSVSSSSSTAAAAAAAINASVPIDPRLQQLKRPAPAESYARSSRSRVEEILTEEPASWVEDHAPNQAFHIGADPAQAQAQTSALPMDLTPFLMTPAEASRYEVDAWSTDSSFVYLPHIAQTRIGSFELPPEYEFTFTQDPIASST